MRHIYTLLFALITLSASAQFKFNIGYSPSIPGKEMADNINMLHSITSGLDYKVPGTSGRFTVGAELNWGMYANTTKEQTFTFDNGETTKTNVNYSSNVFQGTVTGKMFLFKQALLNPYASGKIGYAKFYSNIYIEDPHDPGGCKALDQRNLIKDATFIGGYGGGLQLDWSAFTTRWGKGNRFLDISVNKISGGDVEYINTKKLIDANNPPTTSGGKALNVKFVNATTNQIHEHQVAEVYNTPLSMLEFRITTVFAFGGQPQKSCHRSCSGHSCHH
jgi:hypothetical protein